MWSPWRSNYINSFKNAKDNDSCVFCGIENYNLESDDCLVVYKGKLNFVMLNLYPYNNGHLMIIPYRHLSDYTELTTEELIEITYLNKISIIALRNLISPQGFNFGANIGKAAGAGIHTHLHFHLVPRWNGDTNFMPVLGEVKIISQDLLELKNKLIQKFKELV